MNETNNYLPDYTNKKALILSCSNSINNFSNFQQYIDEDTLIICIKTSTLVCDKLDLNIDIFFYDNRIYSAHRSNIEYKYNDNTTKVICYDYEYETNKTDIKHDIEISVKNKDYFEFKFSNYDIIKNLDDTITIYQSGDKYFPIILKALIFLLKCGVKDYIIVGCDWYNKDITPQGKHFESKPQDKIGFDNLLGSFYSNTYLTNLIDTYNLNIIVLSDYSQITTKVIRINSNNLKYYQKSNFYNHCKSNINVLNNSNYNYLLDYCSKSTYISKKWYKTLLFMFQHLYLQDLSVLNILNNVIIDTINNKEDPIMNLGVLIAMDNNINDKLIIRNNFF